MRAGSDSGDSRTQSGRWCSKSLSWISLVLQCRSSLKLRHACPTQVLIDHHDPCWLRRNKSQTNGSSTKPPTTSPLAAPTAPTARLSVAGMCIAQLSTTLVINISEYCNLQPHHPPLNLSAPPCSCHFQNLSRSFRR